MNKHRGVGLSVIAEALLTTVYILPNYHVLAIKRFFNFMTGIANKTSMLTMCDVNGYYYK